MKKTYNNPQTKVILVATHQMVCQSAGVPNPTVHNSTVSNIEDLQSRQGGSSLWDDDDEE